MLLKDIKVITPLMKKAIESGIITLDEYSYWLLGYEFGYNERHKDAMKTINKIQGK